MLALDFVKANRETVERAIRDKGVELDLGVLLALDAEVRAAQDRDRPAACRAQRGQRQVQGCNVLKRRPSSAARRRKRARGHQRWKTSCPARKRSSRRLMLRLPGIPYDGAPVGPDESFNTVIRTEGEPPKFDFEPLDHVALIEKNDWGDLAA